MYAMALIVGAVVTIFVLTNLGIYSTLFVVSRCCTSTSEQIPKTVRGLPANRQNMKLAIATMFIE